MPLVLWIGSILLVSSLPAATIDRVGLVVQDKVAHFLEYLILGFLAGRWERNQYGHPWPRALVTALVLGLGIATLDEIHQSWIPGRDPSPWDWSADAGGISVGLLIALLRYRRIDRGPDATTELTTKDESR
jgi:VanZ family protein